MVDDAATGGSGEIDHALRGALHNVLGHANLLAGASGGGRERRTAAVVVASARRAVALLDAGRHLAAPAPATAFDATKVFTRVTSAHREPLDALGVRVECAGGALGAWGDPVVFATALDLLLCWVEARARDGASVAAEADGPDVAVTVTGVTTAGDAPEGDLAIVDRLARSAGGALDVTHRAGPPLRLCLPSGPCAPRRPSRGAGAGHVLVVDDDPLGRELLTAALAGAGARVTAVDSFAAAADVLAADPVGALVVDEHVGEGSGIEFLAHAQRERHGTVALLVTGDTDEDLHRRAAALGVRSLLKPLDLASLLGALELPLPAS